MTQKKSACVRMFANFYVIESCETEIFSWADGSFGNLFIAFLTVSHQWRKKSPGKMTEGGEREGEKKRKKKEETKLEDGKHTRNGRHHNRHEW